MQAIANLPAMWKVDSELPSSRPPSGHFRAFATAAERLCLIFEKGSLAVAVAFSYHDIELCLQPESIQTNFSMVSKTTSGSDSTPSSELPTPAHGYSAARRYGLLIVFCLAQFLDSFNNSALFSAVPSLIIDLGITESESTWIFSAFQLTFASFLLIVGIRSSALTVSCSS